MGSWRHSLALPAAIALAQAAPVGAADGVVEINQARALAGSVTATDTLGFPVTIDAPGSYRLTGNLSLPAGDSDGIFVTATSGVTLDLNGFRILGQGGNGSGVQASQSVVVRNGAVEGMGCGVCVDDRHATIERIQARQNDTGIRVGGASTIVDNTVAFNEAGIIAIFSDNRNVIRGNLVWGNSSFGIIAPGTITGNTVSYNGTGSTGLGIAGSGVIAENVVEGNRGGGISAGGVIRDNQVIGNAGVGILASGPVIGNFVVGNSGFGLSFSAPVTGGYAQNVFRSNNGVAGNPQVSGGINLGQNVCQTATGQALCP